MGTLPGCCGLEIDRWIKRGDEVSLQIEGVGTLRNRVRHLALLERPGLRRCVRRDRGDSRHHPVEAAHAVIETIALSLVITAADSPRSGSAHPISLRGD